MSTSTRAAWVVSSRYSSSNNPSGRTGSQRPLSSWTRNRRARSSRSEGPLDPPQPGGADDRLEAGPERGGAQVVLDAPVVQTGEPPELDGRAVGADARLDVRQAAAAERVQVRATAAEDARDR